MSEADLLRFIGDLKENSTLLAAVKEKAAGLESIVALAKEHGYEITVKEAKDYMQSQARGELSDEQMKDLLQQGEDDADEEGEEALPPASAGLVARKRAELNRARRQAAEQAARQGPREKLDENGRRIMPAHLAGDPRQQIRRAK